MHKSRRQRPRRSGGRERRRRFVYTTKNREYHVMDHLCVAVRDLQTGRWVEDHRALRRRLEGGVRVFPNGVAIPSLSDPEVGAPIFFSFIDADEASDDVITSKLQSVDRPALEDLVKYPATG